MSRILILLSCLMLYGCSRTALLPEDFITYVDDPANGLIEEKEIGDFSFSVQYHPPAYEAIRGLGKEPITREAFNGSLKEQENLQYYVLRIAASDKKSDVLKLGAMNNSEYTSRISYFTNNVMNDIVLVDGNDTLACVMHHWERTYKMTYYTTLMLPFETGAKYSSNDKRIIFNDKVLGVGKVQVVISQSNINKVPPIEI